jgi:hypothetical protein
VPRRVCCCWVTAAAAAEAQVGLAPEPDRGPPSGYLMRPAPPVMADGSQMPLRLAKEACALEDRQSKQKLPRRKAPHRPTAPQVAV